MNLSIKTNGYLANVEYQKDIRNLEVINMSKWYGLDNLDCIGAMLLGEEEDVKKVQIMMLGDDETELGLRQSFFEGLRIDDRDALWLDMPSEEDQKLLDRLINADAKDLTWEEVGDGLCFYGINNWEFFKYELRDKENNTIKVHNFVAYTDDYHNEMYNN